MRYMWPVALLAVAAVLYCAAIYMGPTPKDPPKMWDSSQGRRH